MLCVFGWVSTDDCCDDVLVAVMSKKSVFNRLLNVYQ